MRSSFDAVLGDVRLFCSWNHSTSQWILALSINVHKCVHVFEGGLVLAENMEFPACTCFCLGFSNTVGNYFNFAVKSSAWYILLGLNFTP